MRSRLFLFIHLFAPRYNDSGLLDFPVCDVKDACSQKTVRLNCVSRLPDELAGPLHHRKERMVLTCRCTVGTELACTTYLRIPDQETRYDE